MFHLQEDRNDQHLTRSTHCCHITAIFSSQEHPSICPHQGWLGFVGLVQKMKVVNSFMLELLFCFLLTGLVFTLSLHAIHMLEPDMTS